MTQQDDILVGVISTSGLRGPQGPQGPIGPQGPLGIQGPEGPLGETGPQGAKGDKGDTGSLGPAGERGPLGETGPTGLTGPLGPKGDDGLTTSITMNGQTKTHVLGNINLGTVITEHQSLANYSTTSQMNSAIASHHDSTKQNTLTAGLNITIQNDVISATGGGSSYTAGDGIDITDNVISVNSDVVLWEDGCIARQYVDDPEDPHSTKRNLSLGSDGLYISKNSQFGEELCSATVSSEVVSVSTYDGYEGTIGTVMITPSQLMYLDENENLTLIDYNEISTQTLTAGTGISIDENNVISATGSGDLPPKPSSDGLYMLNVASGVATWSSTPNAETTSF